jgi:hypothetical protein
MVGNHPRKKKTRDVVQNEQIIILYYGLAYVGQHGGKGFWFGSEHR